MMLKSVICTQWFWFADKEVIWSQTCILIGICSHSRISPSRHGSPFGTLYPNVAWALTWLQRAHQIWSIHLFTAFLRDIRLDLIKALTILVVIFYAVVIHFIPAKINNMNDKDKFKRSWEHSNVYYTALLSKPNYNICASRWHIFSTECQK